MKVQIISVDMNSHLFCQPMIVEGATIKNCIISFFDDSDPDIVQEMERSMHEHLTTNPEGGWTYHMDDMLYLIMVIEE